MMNWAVGREYVDHTPFRRGSETLIASSGKTTSGAGEFQRTRRHSSSL
jgi:hypothetical protein